MVDVFFVISGFVITCSILKDRESAAFSQSRFLVREYVGSSSHFRRYRGNFDLLLVFATSGDYSELAKSAFSQSDRV